MSSLRNDYECFDVSISDQVAHLTMKRPDKRNSMIPSFWTELPEIVRHIDGTAAARVIVISSTGPHFTSGMDLAAFQQNPVLASGNEQAARAAQLSRGASFMDTASHFQRSFSALEDCRIPVIAAIQGGCLGGGVDLVTACDMRYATEDAFLCIQEINIGMTADVGTFPRLVKLIPEGIVRELAYTGRRMPAAEAKDAGLINQVYADQATMIDAVMAVAREIATKPPLAVFGSKRMITYARDHSTADGLDYIAVWNASMLQPAEMQEAMVANKEKRAGDFVELPNRRSK
ncbi:MAG: crotonase/enoyl-CoA hydratase family protein [Pseudomonadota bacterium]